jgi:hypothetical protein
VVDTVLVPAESKTFRPPSSDEGTDADTTNTEGDEEKEEGGNPE